jgi:saccharopine dehydrogenase (NADP+, L-glutamate forming)
MLHEVEFDVQGSKQKRTSTLLLEGEDAVYTAMAKTVGLPLAVATKAILNGTITCKGLHIPISRDIYEPVLQELEANGIRFSEQTVSLP